jgi:serine/threonine protein kinase
MTQYILITEDGSVKLGPPPPLPSSPLFFFFFLGLLTEIILVADFGIASQLSTMSNKKVSVVGTPYFMAPEVASFSTGYDSKVNLFLLIY